MKSGNRIIFGIGAAILGATLMSSFAHAAEGDDPGGTGGTGCGSYNHTGGDCSVVWYEYTYNENATSAHPQTWIPGAKNNGTLWGESGQIGATGSGSEDSCRGVAHTFYAKGIAMMNTNAGIIYAHSQQFGLASPTLSSVSASLDDTVSSTDSYAFSENFTISEHITYLDAFDGPHFAGAYEKTPVANGHIVSTSVAHEAFCKAIGYNDSNISECTSDSSKVLVNSDGKSLTFEGGSNPASWFCAVPNTKHEELNSYSDVSVKNTSDVQVAGAHDVDGGDFATDSQTLDAGQYKYKRLSVVNFEGDASAAKNKIAFTDAQCRSSSVISFGGTPTVDSNKIVSGGETGATKCAHYDPSSSTHTDFLLFPGQTKTYSATVSHASKIKKQGDTISADDGSTTESSGATVNVTASNHVCTNLGSDKYSIGVNNATNYFRLGLSKNGSSYDYTDVYPDSGSSKSATQSYWLSPNDKFRYKYDMCSGGALAEDANGTGNDSKSYYSIYSGSTEATNSNWIWDGGLSTTRLSNLGINRTRFGASALARITNGYEYSKTSPTDTGYTVQDSDLGLSITNTLKGDGNEATVTGTVKIPYNYYLDPSISSEAGEKLVIGDSVTMSAQVDRKPRDNEQLNGSVQTKAKDITKTYAWLFTLSKNVGSDALEAALMSGASKIDGDYYYVDNAPTDGSVPFKKIEYNLADEYSLDGSNTRTDFALDGKVDITTSVGENEEVGTKICMMVATWPADSHNDLKTDASYKGIYGINNEYQTEALKKSAGTNPYWRYSVDCRTVGKYPSVSIEGSSLATKGAVDTKTTNYKSAAASKTGVFGSWAEYDIASTSARYIGSGASFAYSSPTAIINDIGNVDADGYREGLEFPQTLGNIGGSNSSSDAGAIFEVSKQFVDSIKEYCYDEHGDYKESNCVYNKYLPDDAHGLYVYSASSNGDILIDSAAIGGEELINNAKDAVLVIVGNNVTISKSVRRIDAIIIAKNKLDTCAEGKRNESNGNQDLLMNCSNPLIINGAVYSPGGADNLMLDRTFGGGSLAGDKLDPSTLSQRAEIFNYDFRIIRVAYGLSEKIDGKNANFVKELAPRL